MPSSAATMIMAAVETLGHMVQLYSRWMCVQHILYLSKSMSTAHVACWMLCQVHAVGSQFRTNVLLVPSHVKFVDVVCSPVNSDR